MGGSRFVDRVGGVAVAVGIGAALANSCASATADVGHSPSSAASSGASAAGHGRSMTVKQPRTAVAKLPVRSSVAKSKTSSSRIERMVPTSRSIAATAATEPPIASSAPLAVRATRSSTNPLAGVTAALSALISGFANSVRHIQTAYFNRTPSISFFPSEDVVHADGTITGQVHPTDPDGDTLTITAGRPVGGGSVVVDPTGKFTYTPAPGLGGTTYTDSFTVTVSDSASGGIHGLLGLFIRGWGSKATVNVTVQDVAPPPPTSPTTAAAKFGWGTPVASVDFTSASALHDWWVYDAPGNGGYGRRTPDALSFVNDSLVITGDASGNTGGMMWQAGQEYGAWEVRIKVPVGAQDYNAVALLWPSTDTWPADGEIDFMELKNDPTRHNVTAALHYSPDGTGDTWLSGQVDVDATEWHNYAVVWTPTSITTYVDGVPYFATSDVAKFPPTSMQLCLQLDYAGSNLAGGAQMDVAWARMYSLAAVNAGTV